MPFLLSAATAFPEHRYPQRQITDAFTALLAGVDDDPVALSRLVHRTHAATGVESRHLVLALDEYEKLADFGAANDVFLAEAPPLAAHAVAGALARAGLASASEVDLIAAATVTGIAVPTLDARVAPLLGLRPDVKRLPLAGLGCVAGAAGVARVADLLKGAPDAVAALVCAELCSLTLQGADSSMANIVAAGLFGDGAAAVVLAGDDRAAGLSPGTAVEVVDTASIQFPDSERVMGWDVGASGLRVVLAPTVPDLVRAELRSFVDAFLARHDLHVADVTHWVAHPGGPKVLRALEEALEIDPVHTAITWESLRQVGNLSSASVLHVLEQLLLSDRTRPGDLGLMVAMGPGFSAELVLLRW